MRFGTRTFLVSFVPFAILLMASFWAIQKRVELTVRDGLRSSLRQTHTSIAGVRSKSELLNSRFLRVLSENASLKAGLQLMRAEPKSRDAKLTVEDQLREMCGTLGFDFLLVSSETGVALAGVMRVGEQLTAMDVPRIHPPQRGFLTVEGRAFQVVSTPVNQGDENLGLLSVGEQFNFSEFNTPAVLTQNGKVLKSNISRVPGDKIEQALAGCKEQAECEVRLNGETFISLPMESIYFGEGYVLRSLQSVDSASGPVQAILRTVFLTVGAGAVLAALILSVLSSRSIGKPLAGVVAQLQESERTGLLPDFKTQLSPILEIRELTESFNRAAAAIREARENLHLAYVEFVGSLASALDARDHYTAGHSRRVSEFSCAVAEALQVSEDGIEEIRIGALLHDIGKIGIADSVLQKPGKLTREEFALIQQHPTIGRRILEEVQGFHNYLPTVELHHENWDGSGYPKGLVREATPLAARIVHVADAYDAMTSDRPYRPGMSHEEAIAILCRFSGSQFDPAIVSVFAGLTEIEERRRSPAEALLPENKSMEMLAQALNSTTGQAKEKSEV
ncbi:MAG TPA: HD-GYP domain-containing protein [Bryobacteraceae bacterium]|nr:HD-GYP domain-containing protein [Bryobacteraceae bacterium]